MIDESKWLYRIKRLENYLVTLKKKVRVLLDPAFQFFHCDTCRYRDGW